MPLKSVHFLIVHFFTYTSYVLELHNSGYFENKNRDRYFEQTTSQNKTIHVKAIKMFH